MTGPRRIVVAITGASGAIYGIRTLEMLREVLDVETHLVLTKAARTTLEQETDRRPADVRALADVVHSDGDLGAPISSGSCRTAGMVVAPCSVTTLSGIATSYDASLVVRAADVALKERRRLVLLRRAMNSVLDQYEAASLPAFRRSEPTLEEGPTSQRAVSPDLALPRGQAVRWLLRRVCRMRAARPSRDEGHRGRNAAKLLRADDAWRLAALITWTRWGSTGRQA